MGSFMLAGATIALTRVLSGLLQAWHNCDFMMQVRQHLLQCYVIEYNFAYYLGKLTSRYRLANTNPSASK